jgi:UDP-galactopyranose mutase
MDYKFLIVGCGLSGAVIAEKIASVLKKKVLIIDKRNHIGGNCYDFVDEKTNIRINKYGAHIFHTDKKHVWDYVNKFSKWERWDHKVLALANGKTHVPIPVNINTINRLFDADIKDSKEMKLWLENNQEKYDSIENSEQMAKSRIGSKLYDILVKNYTLKQWNKDPSELDKSVLARIPVRDNFDDRYFSNRYQALPSKGYTKFFEKILDNELIDVKLNTDFFKMEIPKDVKIIYTGPIDHYYSNLGFEKLEYRSIDFHIKRYFDTGYYQPNSVVNLPHTDTKYTRHIEYKHFLNQQSPHTIVISETTSDVGEPYYPVPNKKNLELYEKYKAKAQQEKNIYFVGRLANYKYYNMDDAVDNALIFFEENLL